MNITNNDDFLKLKTTREIFKRQTVDENHSNVKDVRKTIKICTNSNTSLSENYWKITDEFIFF